MIAEQNRVDIGTGGVDVVDHRIAQLQLLQYAAAEHVRDFVPMPDRLQALRREPVGVVAALAPTI